MSPSGERHRRKLQYRKTQSNARAGPSPGGQPFAQQQQAFGGPAMSPAMNYPQMQQPQSAGGYGRGAPQQQQQQWGQPQQGNFQQNGFGGYQG
jgi:nucleolysin TIA-1/TIAR